MATAISGMISFSFRFVSFILLFILIEKPFTFILIVV